MAGRYRLRWVLAIVIAAPLLSNLSAEAPDATEEPAVAVDDETEVARTTRSLSPPREALRNLGRDAAYLLTFPERPTRRGKRNAALVLAGTTLLVLADDELRARAQENRNDTIDTWGDRVESFGSASVVWGSALVVYGAGRLARSDGTSETGRSLLEALLFNEAFTQSAKGLLGRSDPGDDPRDGDFFDGGTVFPSGHTSRAFAFATVLAERPGRCGAWIGYSIATLVGLQRITSDVHWSSDVFAGAALGHFTAKSIVRRRAERRSDRARRFSIEPRIASANRSVGLVLRLEPGGSRRSSR